MKPALRWTLAITGLLVGNLAAVGILVTLSSGDTARRVVPDYYQRAVAWDRTEAAEAASDQLGWRATVALGTRRVAVTLHDRAGAPLTGARVTMRAHPRGRLDVDVAAPLAETAPGVYRATPALPAPGLWDVTVHAARGHDAFSDELVAEKRP
jgi:nitrogen fixation protein FixH